MRAGLLNDRLDLYRAKQIRNEVNDQITEWIKVKTLRARLTRDISRRGEAVAEVFYSGQKTFLVRIQEKISENDRLGYRGEAYRIADIERDVADQKLVITAHRLLPDECKD